jgi:16S rRNA G966 N2-methylase RsmD
MSAIDHLKNIPFHEMNETEHSFFKQYEHESITTLILKQKFTPREKEILQQIAFRQRIRNKLPTFYNHTAIYYPSQLSLEQSSSEKTAQFKASLVNGNTFIDLTAGMGVDSYYFSKKFNQGILVEQNIELANNTCYNLIEVLKCKNLQLEIGKQAKNVLKDLNEVVDLIYIDPARRNNSGGKVFKLNECEPDILELLPDLKSKSKKILIKTSPLLDITQSCNELKNVKNVYAVVSEYECKELLFEIKPTEQEPYQLIAVNLDENYTLAFSSQQESESEVVYSLPLKYLYEPDAGILKLGLFKSVAKKFGLNKLQQHSHLYTSLELIENFPGRIFKIQQTIKVDKKELAYYVPTLKANLTIRNFPQSVAELRKKLQLKEGGEVYIFATTLLDEKKVLILCEKIN